MDANSRESDGNKPSLYAADHPDRVHKLLLIFLLCLYYLDDVKRLMKV